MKPEVITGDVPKSLLPFSPAIRAGDLTYVSGQASVDNDGNLVLDTFENEMRRAFDNLTRILAAAGLTLRHVIQVRSYVTDPANLPEYNRIYKEYFQPPYPARTTITSCLGKLKYEIDVVAYKEPLS
jgi:2-iminobutanoate/2-iminopropanoate deaminase